MTDGGASILSDVTSSLTAAVSSGEFLQRIIEEAAAAGGSAAMAFMTIDVDMEASNSRIDAAVMTLTITTPSPTARPTHTHTPTSGACDSIHVHYGEACSSAHGDAHGCPIVNVPRETWYYDLWSCDDMCGRVGGWCERAAYMSNNHCGSDVHEEYELSCDQGIRDSGLTYPSHTLCWCRGHYYPYYDDEDDDDDDGGSELVMSGGLVAIGLTFTGISIAAIANAVQEQCALGPTIVYEAGTTHPYCPRPASFW